MINFDKLAAWDKERDDDLEQRTREALSLRSNPGVINRIELMRELIEVTKGGVVSSLNADDVSAARDGASLVTGLESAIGFIYENDINQAEAISAEE